MIFNYRLKKGDMRMNYFFIVDCMVGDVNLFFNDPHNESAAELELMIAGLLLSSTQ